MTFYHGTTEENWEKIQKEGVLWGYNTYLDKNGKPYRSYRYTYMSPDIDVAKGFGDGVILEVEYEPVGVDGRGIDNYCFEHNIPKKHRDEGAYCWQFSGFIPISLENDKRLEILK